VPAYDAAVVVDETEFLGWLHSIDSTTLGSDAESLDLVESGRFHFFFLTLSRKA
jgi:hypothetical protein